ncbi:transmembrane protein 65 isoform X1 [Nematostella vectensis]|nr:transmembrane protein 65 isoform X1 [Nematostella vectensis]
MLSVFLCGCGKMAGFSARSRALLIYNASHIQASTVRITKRHLYRGKGFVANQKVADNFVDSLTNLERGYLQHALSKHHDNEDDQDKGKPPTVHQLRLNAFHCAVPFVGFGFLDNAIMIIAGEYIDYTIGATLGISTMAAAALGNLVSDVSGISLAHYVELASDKLGFQGPRLSVQQMEMPRTRFSSNIGRAIGISIGCILGMFPLLFYSSKEDKDQDKES